MHDDRSTVARLVALSNDVRELTDATNRNTAALVRVLDSHAEMVKLITEDKMHHDVEDPDPSEGVGAVAWMIVAIGVAAILLAGFLLGSCTAKRAEAAPVYFEVESGLGAYKWGDAATFSGMPEFGRPRWDFGLGVEWSPAESSGVFLCVGFRYQALGDVPGSPLDQRFVDGPRIAVKWRGRLSP